MKILCCLGYWDGDRTAAQDLALLLAQLLTKKSEIVSLVIVPRFDATPFDPSLIKLLEEKFQQVITWKCYRTGTGFPAGCNEIAYGILSWASSFARISPESEAVFILEADVVLTRKDWDRILEDEWEITKVAGKKICGNVLPFGFNFQGHVNAVALYDVKIAQQITALRGGPLDLGWDWFHGQRTVPVARNTPLNFLDYQKPTITMEQLYSAKKEGLIPLIYHGVKDGSARKAVREKFGIV